MKRLGDQMTEKERAAIRADFNMACSELNMTIVEIQWLLAKGKAGKFKGGNPWMQDEAGFLLDNPMKLLTG